MSLIHFADRAQITAATVTNGSFALTLALNHLRILRYLSHNTAAIGILL